MDKNPGNGVFRMATEPDADVQQEEAEHLEDLRRREEEIKSLVAAKMLEYRYESSFDDSSCDNRDDQSTCAEELRDLYLRKSQEIKRIDTELQTVKSQLAQQTETCAKKIALYEAETEKYKMTLQQSHSLLVSKTEEIINFQHKVEDFESATACLENKLSELTEENHLLQDENATLHQRVSLIEKGLMSSNSDKRLHEVHKKETVKLQKALEQALVQLGQQRQENCHLNERLIELQTEMEQTAVANTSIVTQLTANVESTKRQCGELLTLVDTLSNENEKLKRSSKSPNKKSEILMSNLRLQLENSIKTQRLQNEEIKKLNSYIQNSTRENSEMKELAGKAEVLDVINIALQKEVEYKDKKESAAIEVNRNLKEDNYTLVQTIRALQVQLEELSRPSMQDKAVQVASVRSPNSSEARLREQLAGASDKINYLCGRLTDDREELLELRQKVLLHEERETIIKTLKRRAAQFEEVIRQHKAKKSYKVASTNTDSEYCLQMMVEQEAFLSQREAELRVTIAQEFDGKIHSIYEELRTRIQSKAANCQCNQLKLQLNALENAIKQKEEEIEGLKNTQISDKTNFLGIITDWKTKITNVEKKCRDYQNKFLEATIALNLLKETMGPQKTEATREIQRLRRKVIKAQKRAKQHAKRILALHRVINRSKVTIDQTISRGGEEILMLHRQFRTSEMISNQRH